MCRAQAETHALLERQYGLRVAGRFMPHATIKGFFRSDASQAELEARCARAVAERAAFTVFNQGVVPFGTSGIALHVQRLPSLAGIGYAQNGLRSARAAPRPRAPCAAARTGRTSRRSGR